MIAEESHVTQLAVHHKAENAANLFRKPLCSELKGLSPGQARICELFYDHMPPVGLGVKRSIEECQRMFKGRRWNCSSAYVTENYGPLLTIGKDFYDPLRSDCGCAGTRETAFTHAILSAGVSHEISRTCRLGLLSSCGCNQEKRPSNLHRSWVWGGCGDNINYGYQFTLNFIDICEREYDYPKHSKEYARSLMNRWNNEVGRKVHKF
ncbi:unnamed protein product [Soboliphyme baturini]|uniref:Protein Wnt n=1 Tax=Soboliphyme baturini TaxID=241478 RepID=A0A183J2J2_9BILA|nr:unnamed protein product [Soboliphyme baturini]